LRFLAEGLVSRRVQKLFSMFPAGAPGLALLLLRLALALTVFLPVLNGPMALRAVLAVLLGAGLLTPIAAFLAGVLPVIALLQLNYTAPLAWVLPALLIVLATCLATLGPGAYSVDSRLFGRRVVWPPDTQTGG
jgi:uncharacterized membrane protein YphA (DoxX/SURF4 family)